jgi:hypothetical protein
VVECPTCGIEVKAKNLRKHVRRRHTEAGPFVDLAVVEPVLRALMADRAFVSWLGLAPRAIRSDAEAALHLAAARLYGAKRAGRLRAAQVLWWQGVDSGVRAADHVDALRTGRLLLEFLRSAAWRPHLDRALRRLRNTASDGR